MPSISKGQGLLVGSFGVAISLTVPWGVANSGEEIGRRCAVEIVGDWVATGADGSVHYVEPQVVASAHGRAIIAGRPGYTTLPGSVTEPSSVLALLVDSLGIVTAIPSPFPDEIVAPIAALASELPGEWTILFSTLDSTTAPPGLAINSIWHARLNEDGWRDLTSLPNADLQGLQVGMLSQAVMGARELMWIARIGGLDGEFAALLRGHPDRDWTVELLRLGTMIADVTLARGSENPLVFVTRGDATDATLGEDRNSVLVYGSIKDQDSARRVVAGGQSGVYELTAFVGARDTLLSWWRPQHSTAARRVEAMRLQGSSVDTSTISTDAEYYSLVTRTESPLWIVQTDSQNQRTLEFWTWRDQRPERISLRRGGFDGYFTAESDSHIAWIAGASIQKGEQSHILGLRLIKAGFFCPANGRTPQRK